MKTRSDDRRPGAALPQGARTGSAGGPAPPRPTPAVSGTGVAEVSGRQRLRGFGRDALLNFGAEALVLPVGLAIAAYLARALGAADFGVVVLAITIVRGVEWVAMAPMTRASLKLVSESDAADQAARTVARLHLWGGVLASAATVFAAVPLAEVLHRPDLAPLLLVLSVEPILVLSVGGMRCIFVGKGKPTISAAGAMLRWGLRLPLVLLLVGAAELSTLGAVLALPGAVAAELVYLGVRRPFPPGGPAAPIRTFVALAAPLSVLPLAMGLHGSVDIFLLQALTGDAVAVGLYGAARHVILIPMLLALSIGPILLSTLGRLNRDGESGMSRALAGTALRLPFICLPLAAVGVGAATEVATLAFGGHFSGAGPLMGILLVGGVATVFFSFAVIILIAEDHLKLTALLAIPIPLLSIPAMIVAVPRFGATGVAWATTGSIILGAATALVVLDLRCPRVVPVRSLLRAVALVPGAYLLALAPTPDFLVLVKLAVLCGLVLGAFVLLGEWREVRASRRAVALRRSPASWTPNAGGWAS